MTDFRVCPHLANRNQAQCCIDEMMLCAKCTADYLEKLARSPAAIASDVHFDLCGHNGKQPCNICRFGVACCIGLLYSYTRLNGDEAAARKIARLLKRLKSRHGHLFFIGQHPHEHSEQIATLS